MDALRFVPFSSAPKVAFWQAVAERKLRDWRLDDAPRPARGFYWAGGGARVVLDAASLRDGAAPPGATALAGRVTVVNTLEAFRRVDKAALLRRAGDALAAAVDDGCSLLGETVLHRLLSLDPQLERRPRPAADAGAV